MDKEDQEDEMSDEQEAAEIARINADADLTDSVSREDVKAQLNL